MSDPSPLRQAPRYYPWLIAFMGMIALFLSNGMTATGITIFDPSLLDEFGWSRGDLKFRDALNFIVTACISPFAGILIDRLNPKYLLMFGFSLLTLGYFGYSQLANGGPVLLLEIIAALTGLGLTGIFVLALRVMAPKLPLWAAVGVGLALLAAAYSFYTHNWMGIAVKQTYVIHLMFSMALSTAGSMVVIYLVSSWFVKHRGLAIGIALVGTSMGSFLLPTFDPGLIEAYGWRHSFVLNAYMPIVAFLLVLVLVKGTPKHAGTIAVGQSADITDLKAHGMYFREAIRTRSFWAIGFSGFLTYYAIFGFLQNFVLHLNKSFAYPLKDAGKLLGLFSIVAMFAKLVNGALADRFDRHKVFLACLGIMLLGVLGLASMKREWVVASAVIIGLGWGGLFTLYNMLAVNNFGLREIGRINGAISFLESIGVGIGSWITGKLFDAYGSYQVAFGVIAAAVFVAMLIGTQIRSEVDEYGRPLARAAA
jgi:nitrate/nitrite transporter NarK